MEGSDEQSLIGLCRVLKFRTFLTEGQTILSGTSDDQGELSNQVHMHAE